MVKEHLKDLDQYYQDIMFQRVEDVIIDIRENMEKLETHDKLKKSLENTYFSDPRYEMLIGENFNSIIVSIRLRLDRISAILDGDMHSSFEEVLSLVIALESFHAKIEQAESLLTSLMICSKCGSQLEEKSGTLWSGSWDEPDAEGGWWKLICKNSSCLYVPFYETS